MNPSHLPERRPSSGAALIVVLCFLVLISGLMIAFLMRSSVERQISNASAGSTKAELLADTALDVVVDDLKQEILAHSTANGTGTNTVYIPTSAAYAVPQRSETIANLLRRSSHSDSATRAANASSTASSYNGHSVSLARWNSHYLLPLSGSAAGDSTPASGFTAPDWVIVTRKGPAAGATWSKSLADLSPENDSFAIGRYAYAIYDEGGLLDVNAAGYPSSSSATQYGGKGGLAYADLTQLSASLTSAKVDQIVGWRNYGDVRPTGTFPAFTFDAPAASRYAAAVAASSNSFLAASGTVYNGNSGHAVLNRQQLIKLMQDIAKNSGEQAQLQSSLQYLGTFSREVNGPTYGPAVDYASPYNYKSAQYGAASTVYNPFVLNARVASPFTRADGSQAVKGEPLVKNRFPLEKLALLEKMKGVGSLNAQDKDDIARYFGLDPVASDSAGFYRHWTYPTANASYAHTAGTILSLNDVALRKREPDFFEMLQAGILNGSLGRTGRYDTSTDPSEASSVLQILRIGAAIIDQWDADNFPTTISSSLGDVYGIEDLPYINRFLFCFTGPASISSSTATPTYTGYMNFQLWNPHQAPATTTNAYPSDLQLSPIYVSGSTSSAAATNGDNYSVGLVISTKNASGASTSPTWYWNESASAWSSGAWRQSYGALSGSGNSGVIAVSYANPSTSFREPGLASASPLQFCQMLNLPPTNSVQNSLTFSQAMTSATAKYLYFNPKISYRLQYRDGAGGAWHTYATFVGLDSSAGNASYAGFNLAPWVPMSPSAQTGWFSWPKSDPRTGRFGSGNVTSEFDAQSGTQSLLAAPFSIYTDLKGRIESSTPFASTSATSKAPYRIDMWTVNAVGTGGTSDGKLAANPAYADKDAAVRPGDAYWSAPNPSASPTYSPLYQASAGAGNSAGQTARPVVLNRPFHSVGELGYAFRDMPWKTLDFFSASSADAALLDLFSLNGSQPVLAGRLNPNTRQPAVLAAVLAGATQASGWGGPGTTLSSSAAGKVAAAIVALSKAQPFVNRAELVTRLMADPSLANVSTIKTEREAVIRALADCANTRTWNLMIDLIAQVGKYPATASSLDQFVVEGERHYWLHIAIDRYTGKVVDRQLEVVRE
ncbi:MAG TPA: hypothetical protein VIM58_06425 [Candidatus Methylacidiphilales bacterium]